MRIFLCGFMGSGKTSLIQRLKVREDAWQLIDLDEYIWFLFARTPSQTRQDYTQKALGLWIEEKGRDFFHQKEAQCIREFCSPEAKRNSVIALGGGALDDETLYTIKEDPQSRLVWLDTPFSECIMRVEKQMGQKIHKDGDEFFPNLYNQWCHFFRQAHHVLSSEDQLKINSIHDLVAFASH